MARIHLIADALGVVVGTTPVLPQRQADQYGTFKVTRNAPVTSFSANLEGRMSPTDAWFVILTVTQADYDANGCIARLAQLWPEMRVNQTAFVTGGGGSNSFWLDE